MKLALVVAMVCACGSNVVGPFMPKPKPPQYTYFSFLDQSLGVDTLTLGKWIDQECCYPDIAHMTFPLPGPCLPIPKELQ